MCRAGFSFNRAQLLPTLTLPPSNTHTHTHSFTHTHRHTHANPHTHTHTPAIIHVQWKAYRLCFTIKEGSLFQCAIRPEKFQRRVKSIVCCLFLFKPPGFEHYYWREEDCNIEYCIKYYLGIFLWDFQSKQSCFKAKMTVCLQAGKAFWPLKKFSIKDLGDSGDNPWAQSCFPLGPSPSSQEVCRPVRVRAGEQSRCGKAHRWQTAVWMPEVSLGELLVNTLRRNVILLLCARTIVWNYNAINTNRTASRSIIIMILAFNHQILSLCGAG